MTSPWILTAMGNEVDLQHPRANVIVLADVAHSLAQINRFNGHCRRPYSVAEHSLLVLDIVERLFFTTADVHCRLAALLHDGHEAYVGDMSTSVKRVIGHPWATFEHRHALRLRTAWALHGAMHEFEDLIKQADLIALATERKQLLPISPTAWPSIANVTPADWVDLMSPERCAMDWGDWRDRFADAVDDLDYERNMLLEGSALQGAGA